MYTAPAHVHSSPAEWPLYPCAAVCTPCQEAACFVFATQDGGACVHCAREREKGMQCAAGEAHLEEEDYAHQ